MNRIAQTLARLHPRSRVILQTCVYGLGAGLIAVLFQFAIHWVYQHGLVALSHKSAATFVWGSLGLMVGTSLVVGWLLTSFCPEAAGSGIPQLKLAFWKDFGTVPWRVVWVKFIAGTVGIGGGSSLGREGPSVQLSGAFGSCLAGWLGEPTHNRRSGAAAGAAGGLAAAFNTPLAAVTFVLEEIIGDLNSRFLGSILLASVIGAFVVHGLVGPQPSFQLAPVSATSWSVYLLVPIVAAVTSLVGVLFQKSSLGLRRMQRSWKGIPAWCRPAVGALIAWAIGVGVFLGTGRLGVFGLGYEDLSEALGQGMPWKLAGLLLAAKLAATILCYGTGGCGGIFSPTLFFGAMAGLFLAGAANLVVPLNASEITVLAVVGMSTCLGAAVRAPVTGILIVFEMTHEFSLVPALMLGALVGQAISRRLCRHNFYEAVLEQDGHHMDRIVPPRDLQSWQHLPVSVVTNFHPVVAEALEPHALRSLLDAHPYRWFPVITGGILSGALSRTEAEAAIGSGRLPQLVDAPRVPTNASNRTVQEKLIASPANLALITDGPDGRLIGIVTVHDLLRAEMQLAERGDG